MADSVAPRSEDRARIAAVIPAYDEEKHIADVVRRTRQQLEKVLVVDDGSIDATATNARLAGAVVVVHRENLGKGEAIKTGLRYWAEREVDFVVLLDGDGQHLPEEIERFITAAAKSDAKFFVGTRMTDVGKMPVVRRWVNRYMSEKISGLCGQEIPDTQCGYRMLHRSLIPALLGGTARFDYETEMLLLAGRNGCRVESVPISTIYSDEVSSVSPVRDTIRFFKLIRRYKKS